MKEFKIDHEEALKILKQWQEGNRKVEARLRYSEGLIQSYSGYVTVEPEGQVVIAQVADRDFFFTTVRPSRESRLLVYRDSQIDLRPA
jgi:hypothetical protein